MLVLIPCPLRAVVMKCIVHRLKVQLRKGFIIQKNEVNGPYVIYTFKVCDRSMRPLRTSQHGPNSPEPVSASGHVCRLSFFHASSREGEGPDWCGHLSSKGLRPWEVGDLRQLCVEVGTADGDPDKDPTTQASL